MGSPARQKRLGLSFFAPKFFTISLPFSTEWITHLSGYEGLGGVVENDKFVKNDKFMSKWVSASGCMVSGGTKNCLSKTTNLSFLKRRFQF